jgi:signal transduction histidine kinase
MARRIGFPLRRLWRVRIPHAGRVTGAVALALLAALLIHSAMRMDAAGTPVEPSLAVSYHVGPLETSSADGVWRSPAQAEWRAAEGDELHLGFRGEPVWLRVEVANDAARPFDGMLVYKFPYIDRILFHGYDDTGAPAIRLRGDRAPLDRSLPASHFPAFPVEVAAGGTAVFHLEVTTTSVVLAPLKLYSEKGFERMVLGDHLLFGALFGAVLAVCMYVFTVYLTVRDKAYLDFIPFSLAYAGYVAVASGMGQIWFWPGGWEYANPLFFMLQGLLFASGVRFFQRYLGTPERHPKVDMIMRLLVVVGLLTSLAPVLPVPVGAALIAFVAGPGAIFVFGLAVYLSFRGSDRARVVAFGWGFSQLTAVFLYLRVLDLAPYHPINHYLTAIGCAVATLYFAIALALGLRRQQKQLLLAEELNDTRNSFMAGMSHELRTPLNAIMGFSEMISKEMLGPVSPPTYRDYAADIHDSSRNMLKLVDDVLGIARIESGKFRLEPEPLDAGELLAETAEDFAAAAAQAGARVDVAAPEGDLVIEADRGALRQVLHNLLSNAVKFSPEGGVVTARAQGDGAGVTIGIADQGPGIAEADLERVLQPFEVVRSDAHTAKSGAGLGLPLSRMLAELHGGALTIRAAPDEGTTVIVRLPRKAVAD